MCKKIRKQHDFKRRHNFKEHITIGQVTLCVYKFAKHLEHLENNIYSIKGNDLGIGHNYQSFDYILSLNE